MQGRNMEHNAFAAIAMEGMERDLKGSAIGHAKVTGPKSVGEAGATAFIEQVIKGQA